MPPDAAAPPVPIGTHLFAQDSGTHPSLRQRQVYLPKDAPLHSFLPLVICSHSPALAGSPPRAPRAPQAFLTPPVESSPSCTLPEAPR